MASAETRKDANLYPGTRTRQNRQTPADIPSPPQKSTKRAKTLISSGARTTINHAEGGSLGNCTPKQGGHILGQGSEPSLQSRHSLSQRAIFLEDGNQKTLKDRVKSGERSVLPSSSQESDPVRHAKRRRRAETRGNQIYSSNSSPIQPPNKRTRTLRKGRILRDSTSLEKSTSGPEGRKENYSEDNTRLTSNLLPYVVVEIPIFDHFDRNAYAKVPASSSPSLKSANTQESQDQPSQPHSESLAATRKEVIPDSQDSLGSWNYEPSPFGITETILEHFSKITNSTSLSPRAFGTPDLEVASSPSQTSSLPPSAQPDYIEYYSVDSQISSESSKSLVSSGYIRNLVQPRRSSTSGAGESHNIEVQPAEPLVLDNSILSDGALEGLLHESPENLQSYNSTRSHFSFRYEAVNIKEQDSLGENNRPKSLPKETHNQSSSEPWQGAQIVPAFDFSVSVKSIGSLNADTHLEDSTSSSKHTFQGSSNRSVPNKEATEIREPVPLWTNSQHESPRRTARRNNFDSASFTHTRSRKSGVQQENTIEESLHLPLENLPQSLNSVEHLGAQNSNPTGPRTRSTSKMADHETVSSSSQIDYTTLLTAARDKARFKYDQSPRLDDLEKSQGLLTADTPSQMLPVRENTTTIPTSINPMDEVSDDEESQNSFSNGTRVAPTSSSSEHIIFLPLPSMVRDIYFGELKKHKNQIRAFLNDDSVDQKLVDQMNSMIERLKMITDHQDLPYEESSTQESLTDNQAVKWATTCSPKCLFLQNLLRRLRIRARDIAIVARPGRMLDILELILKEDRQIYNRLDRPGKLSIRNVGGLTVTLIPSGMNDGQDFINRADAVIAFDDTSRATARFSNVAERSERGLPSPVISLMVAFSPGHIEVCLPQNIDSLDRTQSFVDFIVRTREALGQLSVDFPSPEEAAAAVAGYMQDSINGNAAWPLQQNLSIPGLGFPIDRQIEELVDPTTTPQDHHASQQLTPHGAMKRTLRAESIGEANADISKRMRMTPGTGDLLSSGDVTRISDSVSGTRLNAEDVKDAIIEVKELDEEQSRQITYLLGKVDDLEKQLQNKQSKVENMETTAEYLNQRVKDLESRIQDLTKTIQNVQPKYRQAIVDKSIAQAERHSAQSQTIKFREVNNTRMEELARLKEDKTNLEIELTAARDALSKSTIPEAAKLAQTQNQIRELLADKERLEKRVASLQGNFDFTRDAYQKASSYVTELNGEINQLKEENLILRRQASENRVRIAEIQRTSEVRQREERIEELEALLKDRERELAKKSEELKIKTNGRRETRGTSVPRSPRLGSGAMSPRPQFARTTGGSRGASPAPGEAREGFRDPPLFPPSTLGSARYSHLA